MPLIKQSTINSNLQTLLSSNPHKVKFISLVFSLLITIPLYPLNWMQNLYHIIWILYFICLEGKNNLPMFYISTLYQPLSQIQLTRTSKNTQCIVPTSYKRSLMWCKSYSLRVNFCHWHLQKLLTMQQELIFCIPIVQRKGKHSIVNLHRYK